MSKDCCCCGSVNSGYVGVQQCCGKFSGVSNPGCYCIPYPLMTISKVNMQLQQVSCHSHCKTKDNVTLTVKTAVQYRIDSNQIETAVFHVAQPVEMIQAQIDDVLRSTLPTMDLDEAYSAKDKMVRQLLESVGGEMEPHGYHIHNVLITDLVPEASVLRAMNEINASRRMREAAIEKGEADKILAVKAAEADAESKHLSGVGVARMRQAIVGGFKTSVAEMQDCGLQPDAAIHMMLVTQYLDTLKDFAHNSNNAIMVPHGPGAIKDIEAQVRDGFIAGGKMSRK